MQNKIENLFKYINSIDIKIYPKETRKIAFEEAGKEFKYPITPEIAKLRAITSDNESKRIEYLATYINSLWMKGKIKQINNELIEVFPEIEIASENKTAILEVLIKECRSKKNNPKLIKFLEAFTTEILRYEVRAREIAIKLHKKSQSSSIINMPTTEHVANLYALFKTLTNDQLSILEKLPIAIENFTEEIQAEFKKRKTSEINYLQKEINKETQECSINSEAWNTKNALQEIHKKENKYLYEEISDATRTMINEILEKEIENLIKQINNNKYTGLIKYLLNTLPIDNEYLKVFQKNKAPENTPKKSEAIAFFEKVCETIKIKNPPLDKLQKDIVKAAEVALIKLKEKPILPPKTNATPETKKLQPPKDWQGTLKQVRHGRLHPDAHKIIHQRNTSNWADASPLKMLGYSVNSKDGLPEKERQEFLKDFCEKAELPINLPVEYSRPWGTPNTKTRILRTAKHLNFIRRNFERQDTLLYARAIECWRKDFDFIEKTFRNTLTPSEWMEARRAT